MNWLRALLIGLPGLAVLGWGGYAVLFGTELAFASGDKRDCNATTNPNGICRFEVRMERSGLIGCTANSDYSRIDIGSAVPNGPRFTPKLIWKIDDSNATGTYRFRDDGIKIKDAFDRTEDMDEEGHEDTGRKTYRWKSRNKRFKELHFDPQVQRKFLVFWIDCEPKDPLIANAGN